MAALGVDNVIVFEIVEEIVRIHVRNVVVIANIIRRRRARSRRLRNTPNHSYSMIGRIPSQVQHMNRLVRTNNAECLANLRVDRNTFGRLCGLLREIGGLKEYKYVGVEEQVALFLGVLAHHKKNRVVGFDFQRSGETVSKYVHMVLTAILKLHGLLLVKPDPVTEDCTDPRWKWFKGCLGALDGTYINVRVPLADKPRFRTRKGQISTNTLAVCDRNLKFIYVLPGWEGSAGDSRVLRDALSRTHGLKIPTGSYYLCDNGYANSAGFMTPYKGVRYHLKEWGPDADIPQNAREMYNMRHTKARNVIERAFGVMKMRWGILRSASYYPIKVQIRIIMSCFLLHNFIRNEFVDDPFVEGVGEYEENDDDEEPVHYVGSVEATPEWNAKRDEIANAMWAGDV